MSNVISNIIGAIILFPFLLTLIYLLIVRKWGTPSPKSLGQAADLTTPFLFLAVYVVAKSLFDGPVAFYIVGAALAIGIVVAVTERIKVKEYEIGRLLRKTWRLYFLLLLISYAALLITGLSIYIFGHLS